MGVRCVPVYVHINICVDVYIYLYMYVYIQMYICVYTIGARCVYAHICAHIYTFVSNVGSLQYGVCSSCPLEKYTYQCIYVSM